MPRGYSRPVTVHHSLLSVLGLASLLGLGTRPSPPPEPLDLGTLGGDGSVATDVSRAGVVGRSFTASGATHAFLWSRESGMVDLGAAGGVASAAVAVSAADPVVGHRSGVPTRPSPPAGVVLEWGDGPVILLPSGGRGDGRGPPLTALRLATDDRPVVRTVGGSSGRDARSRTLGSVGRARDVDPAGRAVGTLSTDDGDLRGFLWDPEGGTTLLPTLGGDVSVAVAVDRDGRIAGWSRRGTGDVRATLWAPPPP